MLRRGFAGAAADDAAAGLWRGRARQPGRLPRTPARRQHPACALRRDAPRLPRCPVPPHGRPHAGALHMTGGPYVVWGHWAGYPHQSPRVWPSAYCAFWWLHRGAACIQGPVERHLDHARSMPAGLASCGMWVPKVVSAWPWLLSSAWAVSSACTIGLTWSCLRSALLAYGATAVCSAHGPQLSD